jgi:Mn2+/Fe2+ NRAMP family transporter
MKLAQNGRVENPLLSPNLQKPPEEAPATLGHILSTALTLVLIGASVVFLFIIITGGISYMTAGGDKEKKVAASTRLTNGIIGLAIVFCLFAIAQLFSSLFGVDLLNFTIPRL